MFKKVLYGVGFLFFAFLVFLGYSLLNQKSSDIEYTLPRQIRYSFTIQNKTSHVVKNAKFRVYAPVKQTSGQLCKELIVSHLYDLELDELGNQILHFTFKTFPPYSTKIINIKANMLLAESPNKMALGKKEQFILPQQFIESDNPEIILIAKSLRNKKVIETVKNINSWVAGHIKYSGYISKARGALYAFKNKQGDCTEYMYLFTALCRANEIPARGVGGYICAENTILKPSQYHNWAEFYYDDKWQIADTQNNKIILTDQSNYIAMKIFKKSDNKPNSFNRFSTGNSGLKANMN